MSKIGEFLPTDGAGRVIQVGGKAGIYDATATALVSPQAIATGAATLFTVPDGAVQVNICPAQDMYWAPDASASADHGVRIPANSERVFPTTSLSGYSIIAATAGNVSYYFTLLDGDND